MKLNRIMFGAYVVDVFFADLMPILLPNVNFVMPMKVPFTNINTTFGYWFNNISQDITIAFSGLFYATFEIIFVIFSVHLLQVWLVFGMVLVE